MRGKGWKVSGEKISQPEVRSVEIDKKGLTIGWKVSNFLTPVLVKDIQLQSDKTTLWKAFVEKTSWPQISSGERGEGLTQRKGKSTRRD